MRDTSALEVTWKILNLEKFVAEQFLDWKKSSGCSPPLSYVHVASSGRRRTRTLPPCLRLRANGAEGEEGQVGPGEPECQGAQESGTCDD